MLPRIVARLSAGWILAVTDDTTYRNALALNSMLLEYRLESVLGAGGFGMTYLGWDSNLEKHVAIKEYLPAELAIRALDGSIVPVNTASEYNYKWGLDRFIQEARTLARFSHPNIVRVNRFFEANGTSYMVMDYEAGESLFQHLQRVPAPDAAVLKGILLPILDGLAAIHDSGFLHRDIKPSNVFIRANGSPLLIDFGAARLASGNNLNQLTAIVSPGYAPLEQYSVDGNQGPWSDIYALSGVMYRAVTGENPPDAVQRMKADAVPARLAAARARYDERFLKAIEWGLKTDEKLRPQNVGEWRELFSGRLPISALNRAAANAATMPPRATGVAPPSGTIAAAVTQKVPSRPVATQSGPRTGSIIDGRWTWLRRGAIFIFAAIALAAYAKQRAPARAPLQPPVQQQVRPAADTQVPAARRFDAADTDRSGDAQSGTMPAPASLAGGPQIVASSAQAGAPPDLPQDMRRVIAEAFRRADAAGAGYLTRGEVTQHIPRIADKFDLIDANHDGRITLEEIESAGRADAPRKVALSGGDGRPPLVPNTRSAGEDVPFQLKKEFAGADRDGDGYLSTMEVRGRFPAIERNFAEVDGDRDGRISLDEFWQFRRRLPAGKLPQS